MTFIKKNMSIEDRRFYKDVFRLVMPMAVQNLINVGVTSTDVIMLGRVGEHAFPASLWLIRYILSSACCFSG